MVILMDGQWRTQDLTDYGQNPSGQNLKATTCNIVYRTIYIHTYVTEK